MRKISTSAIIFISILFSAISFYIGYSSNKQPTPANTAAFTSPKTNQPELKFFVMSFCPYGNQIEDTLRPIFDLLQDSATFTPHYIFEKISDLNTFCKSRFGDSSQCPSFVQNNYFTSVEDCEKIIAQNTSKCLDEKSYLKSSSGTFYSSLHGRQEANQNVREICAWNQLDNDKNKWWDFIAKVNKNCTSQNADICWEQQGKEAGLDTNKITECFNKEAFDLIEKEIALTSERKITSSPTVLINDILFPPKNVPSLLIGKKVFDQDKYRTPNTIKEAICASMKKPSKQCNTVLPEPTGNAPAAGDCGN